MLLKILEFEESIGKVWDNFLRKKISKSYPESKVLFEDKSKSLKVFHQLLGGEEGKELHITDKRFVNTSRSFLEKISDQGRAFSLTNQDENALYFPASIAYFEDKNKNEMLYFWLTAMAAKTNEIRGNILYKNYHATKILLDIYPGFKTFYNEVIELLVEQTPELSFVNSLNNEDLTNDTHSENLDTYPCPLWVYPSLNKKNKYSDFDDTEELERSEEKIQKTESLKIQKQASQMDDEKEGDGLLVFLPESLMSIMEMVNVDRSEDDSFDEDALYSAEDLDEITLGQKKANLSSRIKMDLDLEYDAKEEYPIGEGRFIDEWDYRKETYLKKYVCIKPFLTTNIEPLALPVRLKKTVKRIENELDLMELDRVKNNRLAYGDEINLDTWIDYKGLQNKSSHHQNFYESFEKKLRDMSTLILADVSLSTEAGITQEVRVIDLIKDGLIVFSEALEKLQDRFAIYTFSSLKNSNVRFEIIKNFKERYTDNTRGRIDAIKAGYYTRLGAAIRESSKILDKQQSQNKLLLIISDGKPNDVDRYDGRYGMEDTKKSIEDARKLGIIPFCITIDLEAKEYLPYLFGRTGYTVVKDSKNLPKAITEIYINLTK